MPPAVPTNLNSWFLVGLVFPMVASHYMISWSANHQYLVSVLLIVETGVMNVRKIKNTIQRLRSKVCILQL
ncbi:hypothetical protein RHGRI_038845 [Rhododendron griersonianum]|uniref:Uncharacterized protein n=1 Tax=Rhododendron griersonianum TaxID=479676 RepID=A0AAV6HM97_9ERIC|nr:hypothetical protein RHGRI_038845 [Rhododendron griersonianum]